MSGTFIGLKTSSFLLIFFILTYFQFIENFEKPQIQNSQRRTLMRFPSEIVDYSKSSIRNLSLDYGQNKFQFFTIDNIGL